MFWIVLILIAISILFLIQQNGKRVNKKLGMDPNTFTHRKGWEAIKRMKETEKAERESVKKWAEAGKAFGDEKLGKAMGEALNEMSGECSECGGSVWNEAKKCGHCGASLQSRTK